MDEKNIKNTGNEQDFTPDVNDEYNLANFRFFGEDRHSESPAKKAPAKKPKSRRKRVRPFTVSPR